MKFFLEFLRQKAPMQGKEMPLYYPPCAHFL